MRARIAATAAAATLLLVLAGGCGSDDADDTGDATTTTAALPEFPAARTDVVHGGTTWAVVLAGATSSEDAVIAAAVEVANDAGYDTGPTDCDEGAAEALGLTGSPYTVSVYFETEADARAASAAFEARDVSAVVAEVQTFCLD